MNTPRMRPAGGRLAGSLRALATGSDLTLPGDLTAEECGCAPTPAESRAFRAGVSRRTLLTAGTLSAAAVLVAGPLLPAAFAATYPSWEDVQAAKANEATKAAEVQRIQGLIQSLTGEVARTRTAAEHAAGAFYTAQQEYFDASIRADTLQFQADLEAQNATDAANKAGRIAAQLYRDGGDTTSLELFLSGSAATADDLLSRLGVMDKLLERNQAVYAAALTARDAAQSLTDQAVVARDERDRLQQVAEQKMLESQQAADAAQTALDAQTLHLGELQAQLAALEDTTAKTIADYQAGVEAARIAEEPRRAAERAEAERLAASGGGGGGVVSSGWARPTSGHRTSGFGPRSSQCGNGYCSTSYHYGVDLSGGCGAGIYAAAAGTVVYAGYNGGYGNYIKIDHGGGIGTGYAHIRPGGFYVGYDQRVNAGDLIGSEGNTGNAFGCNLHFEAYVNGSPVQDIMTDQTTPPGGGDQPQTPPTRRSLRRAATPPATSITTRPPGRPPAETSARGRAIALRPVRSLAVLTVVTGLIATFALPAYAAWQPADLEIPTLQQVASEDAQSLIVASDATGTQLTRESYSATTQAEIDQKKAAEAAAERARASAQVASVPFDYSIVPQGSGAVRWPVGGPFTVTDRFGARGGAHMGTDMVAAGGTPVYASVDGVVRISQDSYGGYGVTVVVESVLNGQQVSTVYPHMQTGSRQVAAGQTVTAGQLVGLVGSTGRSTANHLHFEVYLDGTAVDSLAWLEANAG